MTIRLVITDVDGVLTDGTVWVMPDGSEVCRYSRRDGQAIADMKRLGAEVVLVSCDAPAHEARAKKLCVELVHDSGDRRTAVDVIAMEMGIPYSATCYIGDAESDVAALRDVAVAGGLAIAPSHSAAAWLCAKDPVIGPLVESYEREWIFPLLAKRIASPSTNTVVVP